MAAAAIAAEGGGLCPSVRFGAESLFGAVFCGAALFCFFSRAGCREFCTVRFCSLNPQVLFCQVNAWKRGEGLQVRSGAGRKPQGTGKDRVKANWHTGSLAALISSLQDGVDSGLEIYF